MTGARRVCWRESAECRCSRFVLEELSFKLPPPVKQTVPGNNRLEPRRVQRTGLDELQKPRFVLGASGLQRHRGEMFRCEHPRRYAVHIHGRGVAERFFDERTGWRQELHWPSGNDYVLALHRMTMMTSLIFIGGILAQHSTSVPEFVQPLPCPPVPWQGAP